MKLIKKYTAIQLGTKIVDDVVKINLEYGEIKGPYYDITKPTEEFDTEEEAIKYAYEFDKYAKWIIIPIVKFDNR